MISSLLFLLAGIFNAVMDTLVHHYNQFIPHQWFRHNERIFTKWHTWADPTDSHLNKYKGRNKENGRKILFWRIPLPVMFTDLWHLCKSLMLICICLGTTLSSELEFIDLILAYFVDYNYWIYLAIKFIWFRALFGLGFFTFYNYILIKK